MSGPLSRKLVGVVEIGYMFETLTGLIVRYPLSSARIGGADTIPMTTKKSYSLGDSYKIIEVPYIPGSSVKGRMRGLLELKEGVELYGDGKIYQHSTPSSREIDKLVEFIRKYLKEKKNLIDHVFGYSALHYNDIEDALYRYKIEKYKKEHNIRDDKDVPKEVKEKFKKEASSEAMEVFEKLAITRLIVYDVFPSEGYVRRLYEEKKKLGLMLLLDDFLEDKPENRIDRVTSAADPRMILRIRPGVEFAGVMRLLLFDVDKGFVEGMLKLVLSGLKLVEDTYLGGSGSRGYGRVRFKSIKLRLKKPEYYEGNTRGIVELGEFDSLEKALEKVGEIADRIEKTVFQ